MPDVDAPLVAHGRELGPEAAEQFFALSLDLLCIAGADGYFKRLSPSFCQALGYTEAELLAEPSVSFAHPDDREMILAARAGILGGRPAIQLLNRYRRKDGTYRWLEWVSSQGPDDLIYCVARDVTDLRQTEAELASALMRERRLLREVEADRRRLHELLMQTPAPICVLRGPEHRWELLNDGFQRLIGSERQVLGQPMRQALPELDGQGVNETLDRVYAKGEPFAGTEMRIRLDRRGDGFLDECIFDVVCAPIRDSAGQVDGIIIQAADVAERVRARASAEELQRADKLRALGQMASGVAHDLNQSLALAAGYAELALLAHRDGREPALDEALRVVQQAALDGGETVKRLLAFGRSAPHGRPEPIELAGLLREMVKLTAPRWRDEAQREGRSIQLHVEAADGLAVLGWLAALRQALTNLVFNAVDALPYGGDVYLRAEAGGGSTVVIEVADTGVGMPPAVQARVFEPYFTTKGERGNGLGLAQVWGIVEQHGGTISVTSEAGMGTTFRISLPSAPEVAPEFSPVASVMTADALSVETGRVLRVLAVDDEPSLARMAALLLGQDGHAVRTAETAEQALDLLARHPFDVVLSDLGLGAGLNGWELASTVRERWPATRFILATGWGAGIDAEEAVARGVQAVISKPYRRDDLTAALAAVCGTVCGTVR